MLTRTWTGIDVQPEWKVTLAGVPPDAQRAALPSDASDEMLVAACRSGRADAFDAIVQRHQRNVYGLCYRFTGNHEDASDLAQDVFVRAYRALSGFKGQSSIGTWLYRIAVNVCLNRAAAKKPAAAPLKDTERLPSASERPDEAVLRNERAAEVRAAISRLPKKQRATLLLRVYHELPHAQIAGLMGTSEGAVKANFFHALKNLRKLLEHP
jgi:RNA polymerase sigma-70 factor (ECF subfamily)